MSSYSDNNCNANDLCNESTVDHDTFPDTSLAIVNSVDLLDRHQRMWKRNYTLSTKDRSLQDMWGQFGIDCEWQRQAWEIHKRRNDWDDSVFLGHWMASYLMTWVRWLTTNMNSHCATHNDMNYRYHKTKMASHWNDGDNCPNHLCEREKEKVELVGWKRQFTKILMSSICITLHAHEGEAFLHFRGLKWTLRIGFILTMTEERYRKENRSGWCWCEMYRAKINEPSPASPGGPWVPATPIDERDILVWRCESASRITWGTWWTVQTGSGKRRRRRKSNEKMG